jgi:hypothetical protein
MTEGEGEDWGTSLLLEPLGTIGGFGCTILGGLGVRQPYSSTIQGEGKKLQIEPWLLN